MNFFQILSDIEQVDPEVYDRLDSRRRVFKNMRGVGQKLSAAALPMFVGSVFNKVYGQTPANLAVADVLNFALKLEYLEMYFYQQRTGLQSSTSNANYASLATIATDEANHVAFLRMAIGSIQGAVVLDDPGIGAFDYTGSRVSSANVVGPFGDWRTNPITYFALAQALEDTGVRAYKGAAPLTNVMANKTVLTAALNIHSIEARHASHIRAIRRAGPGSSTPSQGVAMSPYNSAPKSWISGIDNNGPVPKGTLAAYPNVGTDAVYGAGNDTGTATYGASAQQGPAAMVTFQAESNVSQGGLTLSGTTLTAASSFPATAFSEAFDEGLDVITVSAIARNFTVGTALFG